MHVPIARVCRARTVLLADPKLAARVLDGQLPVAEAMRTVREKKAATERATRARAALHAVPDLDGVVGGDFREVASRLPDSSVSLVFTDPPYDRDSLPLYGDLAAMATRKLAPGGSLICYVGQYQIDRVLSLVTPHLRLWWTLAVVYGGATARMFELGIVVRWKPLLWFVKGSRADARVFVDDLVMSEREKGAHPWQQSLVEANYYIEKLTVSGDLVFDPFCGGGTTAVAAKRLGRKFLTCDIDARSLAIARQRIAKATP